MAVLIDSSTLVAIERAWLVDASVDLFDALPVDAVISSVSVMELALGELLADSEGRRNARRVFGTRVRDRLPVIPFGEAEARTAADIFVFLRRAGLTIGERDLMIAATAVANGHSLVTLNTAEFARVPGLDILPDPLAPHPGSA
jgi:predicted nucleic acid-binding protein